jgi:methyltransferase (TIGR00027 family)
VSAPPQATTAVTGTAYWIAAARARETARPDRLFSDPYAGALAGERGRRLLEHAEAPTGRPNPFLPIRTRHLDDVLVAEAGSGRVAQVVLLGAGLDTRAFRLPLPDRLRLFELDGDEVFAEKERILAGLGARPRCRRRLVPSDLTGPWAADLLAGGFFDASLPTAWVAEGLLFYLPDRAVTALLTRAAQLSAPGSLIAADLFGTGLLRLPGMQATLARRAESGLPPPFCSDEPEALFVAAGWRPERITHPGAPDASYGRLGAGGAAAPSAGPGAPADATMRTYLVTARR